jgi:hypothetical protein
MLELDKLIENAEFQKEYILPKNKGYINFSIIKQDDFFNYKLKKVNGIELFGKNLNGGLKRYKSPTGAKKALIEYLNDNKFLFKD